ncbi:MAG: hypothetical protein Q4P23_16000, partial [Micrococcaceae bacterium]|nr:hypothetical protein [Micrococcaceae bacterium]
MAVRIELELLAARAQGLAASARIPEARDMVAGQREHHAHEAGFWVMFGSVLLANDEAPAAEDAARQALALEPDSLGAIDLLTQCTHRAGDIEQTLALARLMVQGAPGLARPHRWVALALLGRAGSRTDLEQAREAIELALEIEPGNPEHYLVASAIAALVRDTASMRHYLRAGLGIAPTNPELLRFATLLDDSGEVAGDKRGVLRGLLAMNPMDPGAREDLAERLLEACVPWGLVVWVYGMLSVLLVHLGSGAPAIAAGLGLVGLVASAAWWVWRRAVSQLPAGFARDVLRESRSARRSLRLLLASGAAVLVGGFVGLVGSWQVTGLGIVGAGTALGFAGWRLLSRSACDLPREPVQAARRDAYLNRRLELLLGTRRP